jgi:hypothetical protein
MTTADIAFQRLNHQLLNDAQPARPEEAVAHMGMVQAQD